MISADGKRGKSRAVVNNIAMLAAPTISVGTCVCGSLAKISSSCGMIRWDSTEKPSSLPICPRQILIAIPFKNPIRIGRDRKSAITPSRKTLATIQNKPARKVTATESDQYNSAFPLAKGPTAAETIAHTAASGFTINCREVPNIAYATSGRMLE